MPIRKVHKRDIIIAAYRLFEAQGFAKTSMADIAAACGLLKGSIYHYFDSKESLIEAVLQSSIAYRSLGLLPIAYNDQIPSRERLERFLRSIDPDEILKQQGSLMIAAVLELGFSQRFQQHLSQFFDNWIQAVSLILDGETGNQTGMQKAEDVLGQLQGAIILSLAYRDPKFVEKCRDDIVKQTFGK